MLRPNVAAGLRVNKLNRNTDARAAAPDTAFQDVADPHLPGDGTDIVGLPLIREGRIAGDDQQGAKFRKAVGKANWSRYTKTWAPRESRNFGARRTCAAVMAGRLEYSVTDRPVKQVFWPCRPGLPGQQATLAMVVISNPVCAPAASACPPGSTPAAGCAGWSAGRRRRWCGRVPGR